MTGPHRPEEDPPAPPAEAARVFGQRLPLAMGFAGALAGSGVSRGLIGPREVPRLWERHILNCAVIHPAIAPDVEVIDVGSGAGLPGLALAVARPDLRIVLVEPMLRRTTWLEETVAELGLTSVTVHRGRAEECWGRLQAPVVTARAVARLSELSRWCLPLVAPHGSLLALKGSTAARELEQDGPEVARHGGETSQVEEYGADVLATPTTVVRVTVGDVTPRARPASAGAVPRSGGRKGRSGRRRGGPRGR